MVKKNNVVIDLRPKPWQQTDANKKAVVRVLAYNSCCVMW